MILKYHIIVLEDLVIIWVGEVGSGYINIHANYTFTRREQHSMKYFNILHKFTENMNKYWTLNLAKEKMSCTCTNLFQEYPEATR